MTENDSAKLAETNGNFPIVACVFICVLGTRARLPSGMWKTKKDRHHQQQQIDSNKTHTHTHTANHHIRSNLWWYFTAAVSVWAHGHLLYPVVCCVHITQIYYILHYQFIRICMMRLYITNNSLIAADYSAIRMWNSAAVFIRSSFFIRYLWPDGLHCHHHLITECALLTEHQILLSIEWTHTIHHSTTLHAEREKKCGNSE